MIETLCGEPVSSMSAEERADRKKAVEALAEAFRETRRIQLMAWFNNDPRIIEEVEP